MEMRQDLIGKHIVYRKAGLYMGRVSAIREDGLVLLTKNGKPAGCMGGSINGQYDILDNEPVQLSEGTT